MDHDIAYALEKFSRGYAAATDEQKSDLWVLLHDDFGLSVKNIRMLIGLTDGQARYAYWKLVTCADEHPMIDAM
jgi:hypothetical protein